MGHVNPIMPVVGQPHASEDPKIRNALIALRNVINGNIDQDNLADGAVTSDKLAGALAKALGVNNTTVDGRGHAAVATSQSTSSSSFTDLATVGPQVSIDVPSDGFVLLYAEVTMTPSANGSAIVGIHEATDNPTPRLILTQAPGAGTQARATDPGSGGGVVLGAGGAPGGFLVLPATAGRRTYKMQYHRSGGTGDVTFADRKLWVIGGGPG